MTTEELMTLGKWEYYTEDIKKRDIDRIRELGESGWELCVAMPLTDSWYSLIFKRPKQQ